MIITNLILPLFALSLVPAVADPQQESGQAPPRAAPAKPASEPVIDVSLWFVSFEPRLPADKLPIDPQALGPDLGARYQKGADGRTPTWGLARQLQANEFEIIHKPYRLVFRDGKLLSERGWPGDGGGSAPWQIVSAPRIVVALNQQGMVSVGRPIQFMAKQDDGCLRVENSSEITEGVELKLTASKILPEGIRFTGVSLKFSRVTGRQPIDGVPFDVGRPIIDTRETSLDITLDNGKLAVIPLPQAENEPALLVFLTARVVEPTK